MTKPTWLALEELRPKLTPMIDIVFLLLVFFMCATKFRTTEGALKTHLPRTRGGLTGACTVRIDEVRIKLLWHDAAGRPTEDRREGRVVLQVGKVPFNSPGDLEALPNPELSPVWARLHDKLLELKATTVANRPGESLPVIIDVRKQVPTKYAITVLNEVMRAGISDVTFAIPEIPY